MHVFSSGKTHSFYSTVGFSFNFCIAHVFLGVIFTFIFCWSVLNCLYWLRWNIFYKKITGNVTILLFCQLSKSDLDQDNLPGTITLRIMETNHLPATMCKFPISILISLFYLTGRRTLSDSPTFFSIWILSIFGATQYWSHSLYVFRWQLFAKLISASCLVLVLHRWQGYVLLSSNVENMAVISKKKRVENKGFAAWGICYNCSTEFFIFSVIFWQSLHSFPTPNRGGT